EEPRKVAQLRVCLSASQVPFRPEDAGRRATLITTRSTGTSRRQWRHPQRCGICSAEASPPPPTGSPPSADCPYAWVFSGQARVCQGRVVQLAFDRETGHGLRKMRATSAFTRGGERN